MQVEVLWAEWGAIAEKAILQFYEENDMSHVVETVPSIPGAKVYKLCGGSVWSHLGPGSPSGR
ncbi:hypothetical protein CRUP_033960 [Coryphaenoides rupestris]|nr:hypothetical protein CRUP_033960 [Coryphaenoides rupestris]